MPIVHGFEKIKNQEINELRIEAELWRHLKTGAELLSISSDDENKVFGITFRTPPIDSTGIAHILEHSVLCGSRKYPVKEPFVQLLKGSLHTFLNAMTYPDKTCYPVASQNLQDFYNLADVYLDAVFYPRLNPFVLQQEGWHYELTDKDSPLKYKGVVFNEMKGAYSSPSSLLSEYSQQSLFPDITYGLDSGGDPQKIPDLTFEQFENFHKDCYHPSNARIFFYGDDPKEKRLELLDMYLKDFDKIEVDSEIPLQPVFKEPVRIIKSVATGDDDESSKKGMLTMNWLLSETSDLEMNFAFHFLEFILLGMSGSPLRKALIDSGYGEGLAGVGVEGELRQMYFSTGLKGIDTKEADKIEEFILTTLETLAREGLDPLTIEAAVNSIEFSLRENNTGSYPRGLLLMLRSLGLWLYDADPIAPIAFEKPLNKIKERIKSDKRFFEDLIEKHLINNSHRTTVILEPDPGLTDKLQEEEQEKLAHVRTGMNDDDIDKIIHTTTELKKLQEAPDSPEDLKSIPALKISDMEPLNKKIPIELIHQAETPVLSHDLFTNGILYFDLGLNLHLLPPELIPYTSLFSRTLIEMGTEKEDYVSLSQRISSKTGGIHASVLNSGIKNSNQSSAWLFIRGKVMIPKADNLFDILKDILVSPRLDNKDRFRQLLMESKARKEQSLVPSGQQLVNLRLRSCFSESDWAAEQMRGVSYLFFLRKLVQRVDEDWPGVLADLEKFRSVLLNRNAMICNMTVDYEGMQIVQPQINAFLDSMPSAPVNIQDWPQRNPMDFEGLTIPAQVNYVGKAINLYEQGYNFKGSAHVITRFLRNSWLWDKVRIQGGAYGAFCMFDRLSGVLSFVSYRDPNLTQTLEVFDQAAGFLKDSNISKEELEKNIIGAIGDLDQYRLPDAKGYISMLRHLTGETDEDRQRIRDEILSAGHNDLNAFADILDATREKGLVKVLGASKAIEGTLEENPDWLKIVKVL